MNPFNSTQEPSRVCPVCKSQMSTFSDGFKYIYKCINCGYSMKPTGRLSDQHLYDKPVIVPMYLLKKGYYELYQPLDEQLFNSLVSAGWSKKEAIAQVISDLDLQGQAKEYFLRKVEELA